MSNIAQVLKQEIQRLARKEAKLNAAPLRREKTALKKAFRAIRAELKQLSKEVRALSTQQKRVTQLLPKEQPEQGQRVRITAKGIRALRRKLRLTQDEFGKLLDVSGQSVWQMERKQGALRLRAKTRQAFLSIRGLGAREARLLLKA